MADLPRPAAALAQRWPGRRVTVTRSERLSPGLRRIGLEGGPLAGRRLNPGDCLKLLVDGRAVRDYTVETHDPAAGRAELIVHLHPTGGPGADWAGRAAAGDPAVVFGRPERRAIRATAPTWLLLGDATAIGALRALAATATPATRVLGAVETRPEDRDAVRALLPGLEPLTAEARPGAAVHDWLQDLTPVEGPVSAVLIGESRALQTWRSALTGRHGLHRRDCTTTPYWTAGRAAVAAR
ncbi:siderophore-interacting protein [Kitasatospora camelliae]|uniref:Siderophore-interacting protein n=1 Tax=Kitasatospora camelliae TaxID=3156397 RepID=A0AAU8K298_9ACTN